MTKSELYAEQLSADGSHFKVLQHGVVKGEVQMEYDRATQRSQCFGNHCCS